MGEAFRNFENSVNSLISNEKSLFSEVFLSLRGLVKDLVKIKQEGCISAVKNNRDKGEENGNQ